MKNVCVFLADGFEEVEALTTVDFLRRAGVNVNTISITENLVVTGAHSIKVIADKTFSDMDFETVDMLVLPGGMPGASNLGNYAPLCDLIKSFHASGKLLSAICAAPMVYGKLGILEGLDATCYPGFEEELKGANCKTDAVVASENVTTSRGPSTATLFALKLIERLVGKEKADEIAEGILLK